MTTRRRRVLLEELNAHASLISGPGAHELIRETTDRLPVWISRLRGFSVSEETARDVIALAERLGYDVEIQGRRSRREAAVAALRAAPAPAGPSSRPTRVVVSGERGREPTVQRVAQFGRG